ncbi:SH3 domain-containing protein [Aquimarina amphilecti]|uniref:SH3 domain-containing protein n=1 Tax=Aquimarina amphilecti TaxID=1038014 RepID=A0A1H7MAI4_AQUAM|nr:SH3 domain-containing protein [Aquimarina amphilecti]SEL08286.1 SH3 domain-containing protein [Aquimarina amphilecti]
MKNTLYFIILIQLLSCKTDVDLKKNEDSTTYEKSTEIKELNNNIKYVIAKSGLNFRKKPKGKIIGKFEFGEKVEVVKKTNIFESITDENKQIKGEWLGVLTKNQSNVKYVFGGFLANRKEFEIIGKDFLNLISSDYEVEYKTEGDLNGDKINDIAIVVKRKVNFNGNRDVIILLKDNNNIYRLDKISKTVFPSKYYSDSSESYENSYDIEDITIANNELIIELYGVGVVGNNVSKFKYFGKKLLLTNIEVSANGAGEHYKSNYNVINGEIITEITNLLNENISTETTTKQIEKKEYKFEDSNPRNINY